MIRHRAVLTLLALTLALVALPGCYRKEISRRSWPGFAVESNATPAPRAQQANLPPQPDQKPSAVDTVLSPIGNAFSGIGKLFQGDQQHNQYTPPQDDGLPKKPSGRSDTSFTPPPTDRAPTTQTRQ